MASSPFPIAADGPAVDHPAGNAAAPFERALFTFLIPIKVAIDGAEIEIHGVEMRALGAPDLPLLDSFRGEPIALAQNVVAALCDITVDQVRQLHLEDFTMLASDALWQVDQVTVALGFPAGFFFQPPPDGA